MKELMKRRYNRNKISKKQFMYSKRKRQANKTIINISSRTNNNIIKSPNKSIRIIILKTKTSKLINSNNIREDKIIKIKEIREDKDSKIIMMKNIMMMNIMKKFTNLNKKVKEMALVQF